MIYISSSFIHFFLYYAVHQVSVYSFPFENEDIVYKKNITHIKLLL
jgi:hypothetical protein